MAFVLSGSQQRAQMGVAWGPKMTLRREPAGCFQSGGSVAQAQPQHRQHGNEALILDLHGFKDSLNHAQRARPGTRRPVLDSPGVPVLPLTIGTE